MSESVSHSVIQAVSESVSESVSQSVSESVGRSVSQSQSLSWSFVSKYIDTPIVHAHCFHIVLASAVLFPFFSFSNGQNQYERLEINSQFRFMNNGNVSERFRLNVTGKTPLLAI